VLTKIKHYVARGGTSLVGIAIFILMLPLTVGMMLLMILLSIAAKSTIANSQRKPGIDASTLYSQGSKVVKRRQKPPIEGSYTVIGK